MQKNTFYSLPIIFIYFFSFNCLAQGVWTQKADFAGGNTNYSVGFSIGTKGYIGTGRDSAFAIRKDFWEYDPASDSWTQKADFGGVAREGAVGFSIGGKGYIGTGYGTTLLNDFWEYDPIANSWSPKANFGGHPRLYATGFSIGGKGYIGTGDTSAGAGKYVKDFWEYDPIGDTWASISIFPGIGRGPGVGFSIGTKGYFGTGNAVGTDLPTKDFWEYDPSINSWTQKADLPIGKCAATGFSIGTKGYIGTGEDSVSGYPVSKTFWEYDPSINVWTQKADFAGLERKHAVAFSIGSKGYMGTGMNYKDFWEYDPNALGINELKEEAAISVYPNPSNAQFNFSSLEKENTIEIFDNTGQPIYYSISKNNFETIDISNKAKGIYFYRITKKAALIQQGKIVLVK